MQTYLQWMFRAALYLGCGQFAFLAFIQEPGNPDDFDKARLTDMVAGTAHKPFVYRTLLPTTVRAILAVLPDALESALETRARASQPLGELFASTPAADENHPLTYLIAYALEFACLIGFALVIRYTAAHFYAPQPWLADAIAAVALLGLPAFYRYVSYDYDFPQLFLFTLGLLLLARRQWRAFYPVLLLGAFNKETTILLVMIHLLGNTHAMPRRTLLIHAVAQFSIVLAVRALLQFVFFASNPGYAVENWIARNWEMISDPARWDFLFFHFAWVGRTALVYPTNYNVLFLLFLPLIFSNWSGKPLFLRRALWIVVPLAVLIFCFGYFDEMRNYYEAYPILLLLCADPVCSQFGGRRVPTS